jgi:hypothetical protein
VQLILLTDLHKGESQFAIAVKMAVFAVVAFKYLLVSRKPGDTVSLLDDLEHFFLVIALVNNHYYSYFRLETLDINL